MLTVWKAMLLPQNGRHHEAPSKGADFVLRV